MVDVDDMHTLDSNVQSSMDSPKIMLDTPADTYEQNKDLYTQQYSYPFKHNEIHRIAKPRDRNFLAARNSLLEQKNEHKLVTEKIRKSESQGRLSRKNLMLVKPNTRLPQIHEIHQRTVKERDRIKIQAQQVLD